MSWHRGAVQKFKKQHLKDSENPSLLLEVLLRPSPMLSHIVEQKAAQDILETYLIFFFKL